MTMRSILCILMCSTLITACVDSNDEHSEGIQQAIRNGEIDLGEEGLQVMSEQALAAHPDRDQLVIVDDAPFAWGVRGRRLWVAPRAPVEEYVRSHDALVLGAERTRREGVVDYDQYIQERQTEAAQAIRAVAQGEGRDLLGQYLSAADDAPRQEAFQALEEQVGSEAAEIVARLADDTQGRQALGTIVEGGGSQAARERAGLIERSDVIIEEIFRSEVLQRIAADPRRGVDRFLEQPIIEEDTPIIGRIFSGEVPQIEEGYGAVLAAAREEFGFEGNANDPNVVRQFVMGMSEQERRVLHESLQIRADLTGKGERLASIQDQQDLYGPLDFGEVDYEAFDMSIQRGLREAGFRGLADDLRGKAEASRDFYTLVRLQQDIEAIDLQQAQTQDPQEAERLHQERKRLEDQRRETQEGLPQEIRTRAMKASTDKRAWRNLGVWTRAH